MSSEFYVESHISPKEVNHQSVSLVVPRLAREKVHASPYYKARLSRASMRCETVLGLARVLVSDLGTLPGHSVNVANAAGGTAFKCLLMRLVELRPTLEQLRVLLGDSGPFSNKYIVVLVLVYVRLQYYFLQRDDARAGEFRNWFKQYLGDFRRVKAVDLDQDCFGASQGVTVSILHVDEIVQRLSESRDIWGLPLGTCAWCDVYGDSDSESESESDSDSDSAST